MKPVIISLASKYYSEAALTPPATAIDPVVEAYWRMRKAQVRCRRLARATNDDSAKAHFKKEASKAHIEMEQAQPTTRRGAYLKALQAAAELASDEFDASNIANPEEVEAVKTFFRKPIRIDSEWLGRLRVLIDTIKRPVGCQHAGVISLKQIYNAMLAKAEAHGLATEGGLSPLNLKELDADFLSSQPASDKVRREDRWLYECAHCMGQGYVQLFNDETMVPYVCVTCRVCKSTATLLETSDEILPPDNGLVHAWLSPWTRREVIERGLVTPVEEGGALSDDPVIAWYQRGIQVSERHNRLCKREDKQDRDRVSKEVEAAYRALEDALPTTQQGVTLKGFLAGKELDGDRYREAAQEVYAFFLRPTTINGEWLAELRTLMAAVAREAEDEHFAVTYLGQILEATSGVKLLEATPPLQIPINSPAYSDLMSPAIPISNRPGKRSFWLVDFLASFTVFGQAFLVGFSRVRRRLSPESSMRWALWMRRSRMASA